MSKVREDNYVVIQGWMLTELGLKGNELLVYAIIYGFSQSGEGQKYTGSLQYLADWTNSTKQGVMKNLKALIEKGLIQKFENTINGVKFCEYYATKFTGVLNSVDRGIQQSLPGGMKQSSPNNLDTDNLGENKPYNIIIDYLNQKAGTSYRSKTKATQQHINARLSEGYTVEDFKTVIDKKCAEWLGTDMQGYLRPETLFGSKFENYLNAPARKSCGRKEPVPGWVGPFEPGEAEKEAIRRMLNGDISRELFGEAKEEVNVGNNPDLAERAERLKERLSGGMQDVPF